MAWIKGLISRLVFAKIKLRKLCLVVLVVLFGLSSFLIHSSLQVEDKSDAKYQSNTNQAASLVASTKEKYPEAIEILEKREKHSKTYLIEILPDGRKRYALDSSAKPVHYKGVNGSWRDIDTALTPTDGEWDYAMEKADYSFFVEKTLNPDKLVEFKKNGEYIRFAPVSLNVTDGVEGPVFPLGVEGTVKDNVVNWQDAFGKGTKLSWTVLPEKVAKILEIENISSLPSSGEGGDLELTLKFEYSDGAKVIVDGKDWNGGSTETKNEIEFRDSGGGVLWSFQTPLAWDSENKFTEDTFFRISSKEDKLYVTHVIAMSWLKSAKFPVYIDPELCVTGCTYSDDNDDVLVSANPSSFAVDAFFGISGSLDTYVSCIYSGTSKPTYARKSLASAVCCTI